MKFYTIVMFLHSLWII